MEIQSKTQLRSRQELEKMTSKYTALEETHKLETMKSKQNENNLYQAKEEIKLLQKENTDHRDIYNQLQEQIRLAHVIQQDLEDEKSKLIEIIDIQKYDLDKANTGLTLDQVKAGLYQLNVLSYSLFY
jgi:hypothetical protein